MSKPLAALDYLAKPDKHEAPAVCVVHGDEAFLKRLALATLREQILGTGDAEFSLSRYAGATAELRDVLTDLATRAMFGGGRRMVLVEDADDFVSAHRPALEDYVAQPRAASTLVLEVKSFPSNTRLAKAVAETGLSIECKTPTPALLAKWLVAWAKQRHALAVELDAAETLIEIIGAELGLLDGELAKLAASNAPGYKLTAAAVQESVGGWRAKTAWVMLDAALEGNAAEALAQLDRLISSGEEPIALLAMMGGSLRRFAAATRLVEQAEQAGRRIALRAALEQAGVKPFVLGKAETQLRQLGRHRAGRMHQWLLDADLALKGTSSSPRRARLVLERLICRMAKALGQTRPA